MSQRKSRSFCGGEKRYGATAGRQIRSPLLEGTADAKLSLKEEHRPRLICICPLTLLTSKDALITSVRGKGMRIAARGGGGERSAQRDSGPTFAQLQASGSSQHRNRVSWKVQSQVLGSHRILQTWGRQCSEKGSNQQCVGFPTSRADPTLPGTGGHQWARGDPSGC